MRPLLWSQDMGAAAVAERATAVAFWSFCPRPSASCMCNVLFAGLPYFSYVAPYAPVPAPTPCALCSMQRARYAVYALQPLDADPAACARRNVHGRTLAEVRLQ